MSAPVIHYAPQDILVRANSSLSGYLLGWLWANSSITAAGCTHDAPLCICDALNIPFVEVVLALKELERGGKIVYDELTQEVSAVDWLEFNYLRMGSLCRSPVEVLMAYGRVSSLKLRAALLRDINRFDIETDAWVVIHRRLSA